MITSMTRSTGIKLPNQTDFNKNSIDCAGYKAGYSRMVGFRVYSAPWFNTTQYTPTLATVWAKLSNLDWLHDKAIGA
jgi:hypothetical protein